MKTKPSRNKSGGFSESDDDDDKDKYRKHHGHRNSGTYNCTKMNKLIFTVLVLSIIFVYLWQEKRVDQETIREIEEKIVSLEGKGIEAISKLHEEYGHHHAVHPITVDEHKQVDGPTRLTKDGRTIPNYLLANLTTAFGSIEKEFTNKPIARGLAGRPISLTPELVNAKRGHIDCNINVDSLAYWNAENINDYVDTYHAPNRDEYYISFTPDSGGWNNVRMSMEIIFVIAAATGRTLVLPPKEPLYLLHHDADERHRGFADFFPLEESAFQKQVKIITFNEFLKRVENDPQYKIDDPEQKERIMASADHCDKRDKSTNSCKSVFDYLRTVGMNVNVSAVDSCIIFDENYYTTGTNSTMTDDIHEWISLTCGPKRTPFYLTKSYNEQHKLIHFRANEKQYRLLTHFYGMIHFTNPREDHYYKRFVRDYLHYYDAIYCAAGKVIQAIQLEGLALGFQRDDEGAGGYSAFHVRRGDLQYKKVKISAKEWYENTKSLFQPNEIIYIATDERKKEFFDDLKEKYTIRYLDDYWDLAELDQLDPNYMGMIDTIIASRGRIFVGTFFSTFTGYINRLRGYHGMSMKDSYYSYLPRYNHSHEWKLIDDFAYAYEWPDGWIGIDANTFPNREIDPF